MTLNKSMLNKFNRKNLGFQKILILI